MAENDQEKTYTAEELAAQLNDALMKNRTLNGMVNDLGDKVKSKEIENSSLRVTLQAMQGVQTGGDSGEASTEEEEQS